MSELNTVYSKSIKKSKSSRKLFSISKEQLNIFKTSIEIEKIENELSEIKKGNAIDVLNFETIFIYNNLKQLIEEISRGNKIKYNYDKRGLLVSSIDKNKNYSFKSKYTYTENME